MDIPRSISGNPVQAQFPTQSSGEAEILAIAQARDRDAFERLFAFYAPRIKTFGLRLGLSQDQAEELAQGALVLAWRDAFCFDPSQAPASAWIYTLIRRCLTEDSLARGLALTR